MWPQEHGYSKAAFSCPRDATLEPSAPDAPGVKDYNGERRRGRPLDEESLTKHNSQVLSNQLVRGVQLMERLWNPSLECCCRKTGPPTGVRPRIVGTSEAPAGALGPWGRAQKKNPTFPDLPQISNMTRRSKEKKIRNHILLFFVLYSSF